MRRSTHVFAIGTSLIIAALAAPHATADPSADVAPLGLGSATGVAATSEFYAGFSKTGVGDAMTAATFRVPELVCTDTDEGYVTTVYAITADGEFLAGPDLFSYCEDGEFVLNGRITTSGGQIPIWQEMEPGDKVRLSIAKRSEGPSTHDVAFSSLTRGWASTLPTNSAIDRIEIAHRRMSIGGVTIPPPDYGRVRFTDVVFDDVPLGEAGATRTKLVDADGNVLINARKFGEDNFRLVSKLG